VPLGHQRKLIPAMMIVVELRVRPGFEKDDFMSEEAQKETGARILTREEAENIGLGGLPEVDGDVRYVFVNGRERQWVERAIDAYPEVTGYNVYDVG
jgi:hypothetical protein